MQKQIIDLLGVGSIGKQVIDIVVKFPQDFEIHAVSLSTNDQENQVILSRIKPKLACARDIEQFNRYQKQYPTFKWVYGDEGLITIAKNSASNLFINALSGSIGLLPTVAAIEAKKDILLANKETLVMAGEIIMPLVKKYQVNLLPIDSEHNALYQLLQGEDIKTVKELILTASGGSLREYPKSELENVTIKKVLEHPNWKMGPKITVDSATMMNKAFEVIETHHLFNIAYNKIRTVLHDESYVHAMIHFIDGHTKMLMSKPNMELTILNALYRQKRVQYEEPVTPSNLSFKPMDTNRFPLLELGYKIAKQGGLMPTIMQAANEAAVHLFLTNKISFIEIERIVFETIGQYQNVKNPSLEVIIKTNNEIIQSILKQYERG